MDHIDKILNVLEIIYRINFVMQFVQSHKVSTGKVCKRITSANRCLLVPTIRPAGSDEL